MQSYEYNNYHSADPNQCWKFPQVHQSEADNFEGGQGTFSWFFFNFMFMIWDSSHEDPQLFDWVSTTAHPPPTHPHPQKK